MATSAGHEHVVFNPPPNGLLVLGGSVGLGAEVGRGGATLEEAAQDGLDEGMEDDLSTAGTGLEALDEGTAGYSLGLGKSHPQNKDKLEDVVEG